MVIILLFLSVLPVYLLGIYIYKNDFDKEPKRLLFKLFILGFASAFLTIIISDILHSIFPLLSSSPTVLDPIKLIPYTFLGIALVEEFSKWIFVYGYTYRRSEFNHAYDAIVYSVFVSLGFACIENILYVLDTYQIQTAITRGLLAVPGHTCDGILMGYFLALAKISEKNGNKKLARKNKIMSIIVPMLAHGLYDYLLYASPHISAFSYVFFVFVFYLFQKGIEIVGRMKKLNINLSPTAFANNAIYVKNENRLIREANAYKSHYCVVCGKRITGDVCEHCGKTDN